MKYIIEFMREFKRQFVIIITPFAEFETRSTWNPIGVSLLVLCGVAFWWLV